MRKTVAEDLGETTQCLMLHLFYFTRVLKCESQYVQQQPLSALARLRNRKKQFKVFCSSRREKGEKKAFKLNIRKATTFNWFLAEDCIAAQEYFNYFILFLFGWIVHSVDSVKKVKTFKAAAAMTFLLTHIRCDDSNDKLICLTQLMLIGRSARFPNRKPRILHLDLIFSEVNKVQINFGFKANVDDKRV